MNPLKLWIVGGLLIVIAGFSCLAGIRIADKRTSVLQEDYEVMKESAQYHKKQASKWKHRTELLEDAFGIGTVQNPAEGL